MSDTGNKDRSPAWGRWRRGLFSGGSSLAGRHAAGWKERHWTSRLLHRVGEIVGHSNAGMVAATGILIWAVVGIVTRFPGWWETTLYALTASITFVMVFVIQHTQTRQISAMQRKLDELIRTHDRANDALIAAEEAPDDEIEAMTDRSLADRGLAISDPAPAPTQTNGT